MNENMTTNIGVIMRSNQPKRFARHVLLVLLGLLFMLAGGIVHATAPATASAARQDAAFDALLNLMRERLLLMHEVAKWKWNEAKPITDVGRERELLAALERRGAVYGLGPKQVRAFLAAQIKAAKLIQEADFNAWKNLGQGKFSDARDLSTDLRPKLDNLSDQMLGQLAKVAPLLGDEETKTYVGRRAKSAIRGDGINDEVRTVATRPLLADSAEADRAAPPPAAKRPVADVYHGVEVRDDYRWLEDWSDSEVQQWSAAQNVHARAYLDNLPHAKAIRARLTELETGSSNQYTNLVRRGARLLALKQQPPKQQPLLVCLPDADDAAGEQVIVDPNELDAAGHTSIDWFVPSPDGKLVAVSLSEGGSESGTVHVYQANDGKERQRDRIPRVNGGTAGGSLAWGPEDAGFYYTRYPRQGERPAEDLDFYMQVYYHQLGASTSEDRYELGQDFPRIAEIELQSSADGRWLLASVQKGDGGEFMHHVRSPDGWKQVTRFEDRVVEAALGADEALYLISRDGAPRGKMLRLALKSPKISEAKCIVPESDVTIVSRFGLQPSFVVTPRLLYVLDQVGGPNEVRIFNHAGNFRAKLPLPDLASVGGMLRTEGDDVLFQAQTFISPPAWYRYSPKTKKAEKTSLCQKSPADYEGCEVVREMATSKDGTRLPVNIIRRKGLKLDGQNPTILNGYGGYGISLAPRFSPTRQLWLEQGGVFAIANLRGGGEFGDAWHRAGNLTNKQNVFDDFYAAANHLIEAGYTSPERLAIMGGSNGGLLMGATFTQHPELCRAVVSQVGIYDMLRVELSPNGAFNVTEFGTVADERQFDALHAYSPYHHVKDGAKYPAILFLTGANDPRVDPMQSRKMTARLQAASPGSLTLLRTNAEAGHGIGSSLAQRIEEGVDVYSFLFQELDLPYHPVKP